MLSVCAFNLRSFLLAITAQLTEAFRAHSVEVKTLLTEAIDGSRHLLGSAEDRRPLVG